MQVPFPDFERLHKSGRIKFLYVGGKFLIYNSKDSSIFEIPEIPPMYKEEVITTPKPPVKTLILHTTYQCNFGCTHCYMNAGETVREEMNSDELSRIVREFGQMGGLGVDLSGGEALLKPDIEKVIDCARKQKLRTVVLSNAGKINRDQIKRIAPQIDGIAVGIDGLYEANDQIRGKGTFNRILNGLEIIAGEGVELSFTTLITPQSIPQLLDFPEFIKKYGGRSWSLVMPRPSGRFADKTDLIAETYTQWGEAKRSGLLTQLQDLTKPAGISVILDHILVPGSKKRVEESSRSFVYDLYNRGRACWDNTLTVMPNGDVKCCLFFDGQVYDNVRNKPLADVYQSQRREAALIEFRKFPVDKCPFLERDKLQDFDSKI